MMPRASARSSETGQLASAPPHQREARTHGPGGSRHGFLTAHPSSPRRAPERLEREGGRGLPSPQKARVQTPGLLGARPSIFGEPAAAARSPDKGGEDDEGAPAVVRQADRK